MAKKKKVARKPAKKKTVVKKKAAKKKASPKKAARKRAAKKKATKKTAAKKKSAKKKAAAAAASIDSSRPRLFELHDGKSDKFWIIELSGTSHTVRYGRQGTDGQTKTKDFASASEAQASYEKLITQKEKKGYVEVTVTESRGSALKQKKALAAEEKPFLNEILEAPDNLDLYAVYADWLIEQGDPRGEFMSVQLSLEDESLKTRDRKRLKKQEEKLLENNVREWLDDLAPYLIDQLGLDRPQWNSARHICEYQHARGFVDALTVGFLMPDFAAALAKSPEIRMIRRLHLEQVPSEEPLHAAIGFEDVDFSKEANPCFAPLYKASFDNLRYFELYDYDNSTYGANVHKLIRRMPRLEELILYAHHVDTKALFKLPMPNLRNLEVWALTDYAIDVLARNKSLSKLETLFFFPHALEHWHTEPYLQVQDLRAICRSKNLTSLRKLAFKSSAVGDAGIRELAKSNLLPQLKELDLEYGCITDEGAEILARADLSSLDKLDISGNYLTAAGIDVLRSTGVDLVANRQYTGDPPEDYEYAEFLGMGDME